MFRSIVLSIFIILSCSLLFLIAFNLFATSLFTPILNLIEKVKSLSIDSDENIYNISIEETEEIKEKSKLEEQSKENEEKDELRQIKEKLKQVLLGGAGKKQRINRNINSKKQKYESSGELLHSSKRKKLNKFIQYGSECHEYKTCYEVWELYRFVKFLEMLKNMKLVQAGIKANIKINREINYIILDELLPQLTDNKSRIKYLNYIIHFCYNKRNYRECLEKITRFDLYSLIHEEREALTVQNEHIKIEVINQISK